MVLLAHIYRNPMSCHLYPIYS
ncbi:hypothetical protein F383_38259 [Gossypium arboreum]|uniref:Uncharacterized protein n=1 Tax=Gossypium arboreum TaxID=29729 RepID=A0A0B0MEA0_GOSAR|nr:hypothetical protein F383_38259 [Gossypium arboreum]